MKYRLAGLRNFALQIPAPATASKERPG
jgi:hypothetical protein